MVFVYEAPLFQWDCVLKGFLSGSLIVGSLVNPYGFSLQSILFLTGFLVFLDGIIYVEKDASVGITILTLIIGGLTAGILTILGLSLMYMILIFLITLIYYLFICREWLKRTTKRVPRVRRK